MTALFATAFVLGLAFNAAPGAVFAETVRQGLRGGFRPALAVQVGSLVGDATWAVLGLAGIGLALQVEALRWPVGLAGAAYLAWLSAESWRAARVEHALDTAAPADSRRRALRSGMLLSLTNPQNLAYWAAMGSALGALGLAQPTPADYAVFFAGFMASSILWCFVCAAVVDRLLRRAGARWARFTYRLCAALLLALALGTLRDLLQGPAPKPPPSAAAMPAAPLD
ncbi:LysE family transporter [Paracidovorax anthurii]|uniref:Chemosensory pili system protein ChpE/L-lysine exporter family protein LysE/ArgO n=1 Tax=Paracidovorax anthurii TaxID=78229 RepID=A0A328YLQ7_9BURK|nr:LysE family transporter [Paracidovorax anthurii]RAR74043.1 chemosensory pili system protein ChpE/L-lysine exporter family protein LysE/ArgO [Paracidovorax anthurii]